jgi:hypothetical protein
MACAICGRERVWHGSEHPAARPGTHLIESGCHDGTFMDDDEHFEGWASDTVYPPCPHNPACCQKCGGSDFIDGGDCDACESGWIGGPQWPISRAEIEDAKE